MNSKHKFLYVFLCIITLGFICIYWKRKYRQKETKNYLSTTSELAFDYKIFLLSLGGIKNLQNATASQKIIRIGFIDRALINIDKLKELDGISGINFQSNSISLVVGNSAKYLEEKIKEDIQNDK
ncbi:PTS glucose transporter subunit IIB [Metamycoplasma equirhinis]|uniref:PTS glucose transporter subunit IIB n=1 Tax=Metamycoplasma equirhinis TaxID=92402 RepID=UPI00359351A5